jgi:hypothetical protein
MLRVLIVFVAVVVLSCFAPASSAQTTTSPPGTHLPPLAEESQGMPVPVKTQDEVNQERLQKYRLLRQQELLQDAAKLHQLSGEIQAYLDKNNSTMLSIEMIKKAEAMEKLAKSVRQKMKELQ